MKRNEEENVEKILRNSLPSVSTQYAESVGNRILEGLQSGPSRVPRRTFMDFRAPSRLDSRWGRVLAIAAAIAIVVLIPITMLRRASAVFEDASGSRRIQFGEVVHAYDGGGSTLVLADTSRVEMRAKSELSIERAEDGVRIQLRNGDIIVNAAKQHGHLYVQTKDVMVSVVGTVFLVKAEAEGSRVAVIEGEVHVKQGATETKLQPGEQVASNPRMESLSVKEQVAWSHEAVTHLALLPQAVAAQKSDGQRLAFEVASIRPAAPRDSDSGGARGAGGGGGSPILCDVRNIQLDPRRLNIREATLYELVGWALGRCAELVGERAPVVRVSGGAKWMTSDRWDVEALFTEGSVTPLPATPFGGPVREFQWGRSPKAQRMLLTLLEDRFNLVIRREMKEMPVYLLTVAPGGTKFQGPDFDYGQVSAHGRVALASPAGQRSDLNRGTPAEGLYTVSQGASGIISNVVPCFTQRGQNCQAYIFANQAMSEVATIVSNWVDRPVIDRTGIQEPVSFAIEWLWTPKDSTGPGRGLALPVPVQEKAKALEAVGLLLKDEPKGQVATFVIERAEKPSEN
jgi:uncharacterized protein (TIGR03435 family)